VRPEEKRKRTEGTATHRPRGCQLWDIVHGDEFLLLTQDDPPVRLPGFGKVRGVGGENISRGGLLPLYLPVILDLELLAGLDALGLLGFGGVDTVGNVELADEGHHVADDGGLLVQHHKIGLKDGHPRDLGRCREHFIVLLLGQVFQKCFPLLLGQSLELGDRVHCVLGLLLRQVKLVKVRQLLQLEGITRTPDGLDKQLGHGEGLEHKINVLELAADLGALFQQQSRLGDCEVVLLLQGLRNLLAVEVAVQVEAHLGALERVPVNLLLVLLVPPLPSVLGCLPVFALALLALLALFSFLLVRIEGVLELDKVFVLLRVRVLFYEGLVLGGGLDPDLEIRKVREALDEPLRRNGGDVLLVGALVQVHEPGTKFVHTVLQNSAGLLLGACPPAPLESRGKRG